MTAAAGGAAPESDRAGILAVKGGLATTMCRFNPATDAGIWLRH
jgi:hypothetical protein